MLYRPTMRILDSTQASFWALDRPTDLASPRLKPLNSPRPRGNRVLSPRCCHRGSETPGDRHRTSSPAPPVTPGDTRQTQKRSVAPLADDGARRRACFGDGGPPKRDVGPSCGGVWTRTNPPNPMVLRDQSGCERSGWAVQNQEIDAQSPQIVGFTTSLEAKKEGTCCTRHHFQRSCGLPAAFKWGECLV